MIKAIELAVANQNAVIRKSVNDATKRFIAWTLTAAVLAVGVSLAVSKLAG